MSGGDAVRQGGSVYFRSLGSLEIGTARRRQGRGVERKASKNESERTIYVFISWQEDMHGNLLRRQDGSMATRRPSLCPISIKPSSQRCHAMRYDATQTLDEQKLKTKRRSV